MQDTAERWEVIAVGTLNLVSISEEAIFSNFKFC